MANVSQGLYLDTRMALRAAKSQFPESLYYQTDTHWNSLGAWVAFSAFETKIARSEAGLRRLTEQPIRLFTVNERQGGDLAKFLRLKETLRDTEVVINITSDRPIETEHYDFDTGSLKLSGGNPQIHSARRSPPEAVRNASTPHRCFKGGGNDHLLIKRRFSVSNQL